MGFLVAAFLSMSFVAESNDAIVALGERLFKDHRFSQHYYSQCSESAQCELPESEILVHTAQWNSSRRSFAVSCSSCHQVDQNPKSIMLSYADNRHRSPIPFREEDGQILSRRNTQSLLELFSRPNRFFHHDGELTSVGQTVGGNFTGRHHGWLVTEKQTATQHWLRVLTQDDGSHSTAKEFGSVSYGSVFSGAPVEGEAIPPSYQVDFSTSSAQAIRVASTQAIVAYLQDLSLEKESSAVHVGSSYDLFLKSNGIRRQPLKEETEDQYLLYLKRALKQKTTWKYIDQGEMKSHPQSKVFSEKELRGFRLFIGAGQCASCHKPPHFTDHGFHNVGISQMEYEIEHGFGSFTNLAIPNFEERNGHPELYFPADSEHPHYQAIFNQPPQVDKKAFADLGVWNHYGRFHPEYDRNLNQVMSLSDSSWNQLDKDEKLNSLVGRFVTPTLRNLGHSGPYFHNGAMGSLEAVVGTYISVSQRARFNTLRNPDPILRKMQLETKDISDLVAFLKSLNEEYE